MFNTNKYTLALLLIVTLLVSACQAQTTAAVTPTATSPAEPVRTATATLETPVPSATLEPEPKTAFSSLEDFEQQRMEARAGDVDAFWQTVLTAGQMPLTFGQPGAEEGTAVFLYRGEASVVRWVGDFNDWQQGTGLRGERLGESDIWIVSAVFPLDARLEYKIIVNSEWLLDPLNPLTQLGGFGTNSVLQMPDYIYPEVSLERSDIEHGILLENQTLQSEILGYPVNYRVYTPTGIEQMAGLPVIYVTDGQNFADSEFGGMVNTLDNLIAEGLITPVLAVFIDPRDPESGTNRRESELGTSNRFGRFLTEELIPAVDSVYPTAPDADHRLILGTSWGGVFATYIGQTYPDLFHKLGIFSPYYVSNKRLVDFYAETDPLPQQIFLMQGSYDVDVANTRRLRDALQSRGYDFKYIETHDGHSWGNWRGMLDDLLLFFFAAE